MDYAAGTVWEVSLAVLIHFPGVKTCYHLNPHKFRPTITAALWRMKLPTFKLSIFQACGGLKGCISCEIFFWWSDVEADSTTIKKSWSMIRSYAAKDTKTTNDRWITIQLWQNKNHGLVFFLTQLKYCPTYKVQGVSSTVQIYISNLWMYSSTNFDAMHVGCIAIHSFPVFHFESYSSSI